MALDAKRLRGEVMKMLKALFTCESSTADGRVLREKYMWEGRNRFIGAVYHRYLSLHLEPSYAMEVSRRVAQELNITTFAEEMHRKALLEDAKMKEEMQTLPSTLFQREKPTIGLQMMKKMIPLTLHLQILSLTIVSIEPVKIST